MDDITIPQNDYKLLFALFYPNDDCHGERRKEWSARNKMLVEQGAYTPSNKLVATLLKLFPTMGGLFINYGMVYLGFHYTYVGCCILLNMCLFFSKPVSTLLLFAAQQRTYVASFALAFVALQQGLVPDIEPEVLFDTVSGSVSRKELMMCSPARVL